MESAAVVCARASWQRASLRRVFVWGLGGGATSVEESFDLDLVGDRGALELVAAEREVEAGVDVVVVWRVLASWQSASAGRKRLIAM